MIKSKLINRKFYNKWLYKVSLKIPGVVVFRMYGISDVGSLLDTHQQNHYRNSIIDSANANRDIIENLAMVLLSFDKDSWSKRIERNMIDLYTNDKAIFNAISEKFEEVTIQRFEPSLDKIDLYDESSIIVQKLPHNKYRFKVFLLPHKFNKDKDLKKQYVNWVSATPAILISDAVKEWFIKTDWNWDRRYVLVEDEHTLLMLKLRNSEAVGRIYKYVIADK
jgi:hypothetical protein